MPSSHIVGDTIHKYTKDCLAWSHDLRGLTPWVWWETISILVGASVCSAVCASVHLCVLVHLWTVCTCVVVLCAVCWVPKGANVCACVLVAAKYLTMTLSLSVLVWDVFRQRTISKLLIRQFDFNETSSVDSRQQYQLSMKNGKIVRNKFVIQF